MAAGVASDSLGAGSPLDGTLLESGAVVAAPDDELLWAS
jgi:hypothetical protein